MKTEFNEAYNTLFTNTLTHLDRLTKVKLRAIKYSNKYIIRDKDGNMLSYKRFGSVN